MEFLLFTILLGTLFPQIQCKRTGKELVVDTDKGPVLGREVISLDPRHNQTIEYNEFLAIPFAKPPLHELRFSPPVEPDPWTLPFNSSALEKRVCYQLGGLTLGEADEDCLYLNVFSPIHDTDVLLPVMVWMTGGAFLIEGSNWYGADYWMIHEIVLVVINYRVGPFGFLTLGTPDAPGNAGMLDQLAAMEWVQRNIDRFGGDPSRVTLAGESAGSYSTFYHLASPRSQGLFSKIIGQSGMGGLAPAFHQYTPQQAARYGHEAAIEVGCLQLTNPAILECLRAKESSFFLSLVDFSVGDMSQPVVDGEIADNPFLPEYPRLAFENGDYDRSVDILLGTNYNEGMLFTQLFYMLPPSLDMFLQQFDLLGPMFLFMRKALEVTDDDIALAREVLDYYTDGADNITMNHIDGITNMFTDAFFWAGVHRFIEIHRTQSEGKLYHYMNKHINDEFQLLWTIQANGTVPGVSHGDELSLQFSPFIGFPNNERSERDWAMSRLVTTAWSDFMKMGDPGLSWQPVTSDEWEYMSLAVEPRMEMEPEYLERMEFWKHIVHQLEQ